MNSRHSRHSNHSPPLLPCFFALCALLIGFIHFTGCKSSEIQIEGEGVLIRVGESTVTVREFHEAFDSDVTSPSVLYGDMEALRNEKYRILKHLIEELIILERARELGVQVSDEELALAVNDFKKDFPDDTFEQTLMENGVSYLSWEKGVKRRLLMEKVIREDVAKGAFPVPLSFDETTSAHLNADLQIQFPLEDQDTRGEDTTDQDATDQDTLEQDATDENGADNTGGEKETPTGEKVSESRDTNTETALNEDAPGGEMGENSSSGMPESGAELEFDQWINQLKKQYTIEIDWKLWEKIEQGDAEGA